LIAKICIGIVLELHGIALQRPQNCIGILLPKQKLPELVFSFYCKKKNVQNWYWYFIVVKKSAMPNPGIYTL
jgi:hypothetical protein